MRKVSIMVPESKPIVDNGRFSFQTELVGSNPTIHVNVEVFQRKPADPFNCYFKKPDTLTQRVVLYGGTPDAFDTILKWWDVKDKTHEHEFEYYPDYPVSSNCFKVLHYWNCNPNCIDDSAIHFDGQLDVCEVPLDRAFHIAVDEIYKSSQIVTDVRAQSLKRLAECADDIRGRLLPELIEEARTTRLAVQQMANRTNGKSLRGYDLHERIAPEAELKSSHES